MLVQLTIGFLAFAIVLIAFAMFSNGRFPREMKETFVNVTRSEIETITPGGTTESSDLSPAPANNELNEYLIAASGREPMPRTQALTNWGKMTSERCYRSDIGESLKKTRNFLQRTNNYIRSHPDSCSAPFHELVGTFYNPFDGVGRTPASGDNYPPSTLECTA